MELLIILEALLAQLCVSVVICILFLSLIIRHVLSVHIMPSIKVMSVLYFLCYTLAFMCFVAQTVLEIRECTISPHGQQHLDDAKDIVWTCGLSLAIFSQLAFYLLIVIRLHNTFRDTAHRTSNCFYIAFAISIAVIFLSGSIYIALVQMEEFYIWRVVSLMTTGGMIICVRILLIGVFVHKLINLSAQRQAVVHPDLQLTFSGSVSSARFQSGSGGFRMNSHDSMASITSMQASGSEGAESPPPMTPTPKDKTKTVNRTISGRECVVLVTITKQTVLGTVAILCGGVAYCVLGIERMTRDPEGMHFWKYGGFTYLAYALGTVSVWIEMLCVYLGYSFNQNLYWSVCSKCHDMCALEVTDVQVKRRSLQIQQKNSADFEHHHHHSPRIKNPPLPEIEECDSADIEVDDTF